MMKTSDVAKELGINPKTVLKWVKQHDIPCEKNELGHFEFTDQHLEQLKQVQSNSPSQRVASTVSKREGTVSLTIEETEKWQEMQKQIDQMLMRLMENERRIEEKAGEVVTFQILEHRSEIDDLQQKVEKLEARIQELEEKKQTESSLSHLPQKRTSRWRTFLTNLL
ncbi:MerR family transcriptional regulator [Priestia abyssalis]|uniref:MerR family transcriptional regulator n=1 Tax=Priestia abyssalis TaxID=1221450 RepID=UPI000994BB21|nr:MerR family transcriptional regulator [Priestia abyssalis]